MSQQQQEETVLTITGKRSAVQSAKSMLGAKLEEWHQFYGTSSGNGFLAQSAIATLLSSSAPSSARSLYPSDEPWGGEFTETDAIDEDDESNLVLEMCVKVLINMEWADWLVGVSDGNCENILLGINYRTGAQLLNSDISHHKRSDFFCACFHIFGLRMRCWAVGWDLLRG